MPRVQKSTPWLGNTEPVRRPSVKPLSLAADSHGPWSYLPDTMSAMMSSASFRAARKVRLTRHRRGLAAVATAYSNRRRVHADRLSISIRRAAWFVR
jgi:hypothetical protein